MKLRRTRDPVAKRRRTLPGRGQRGFVLIEVLVAMAIFGVISVGFLSALVAGYHGVVVAHDQTMAQNLTKTALENVRSAAYPIVNYETAASKYDVAVEAEYIDEDFQVVTGPTSVQMITVTVEYHETGKAILVTNGIKVQP